MNKYKNLDTPIYSRIAIKNKIVVLATMSVIVAILALAYGKVIYDDIEKLQHQRNEKQNHIKDMEWSLIDIIWKENSLRAKEVTTDIKKNIY